MKTASDINFDDLLRQLKTVDGKWFYYPSINGEMTFELPTFLNWLSDYLRIEDANCRLRLKVIAKHYFSTPAASAQNLAADDKVFIDIVDALIQCDIATIGKIEPYNEIDECVILIIFKF